VTKHKVQNFYEEPTKLPEIKETPLAKDFVEYLLPGKLERVAMGGGGRYFIAHIPSRKSLAIFDVNQGKITKQLRLPTNQISFAAGADKLVLLIHGQRLIQRYDLETLKLELTMPVNISGQPSGVTMGCAANGPLLIKADTISQFLDLHSLQKHKRKIISRFPLDTYSEVRCSANGLVFVQWDPSSNPVGLGIVAFDEGDMVSRDLRSGGPQESLFLLKNYGGGGASGAVLPGADGKYCYGQRAAWETKNRRAGGIDVGGPVFPEVNGKLFVKDDKKEFSFYSQGSKEKIVSLPMPEILKTTRIAATSRHGWKQEGRYFISQANLMILVPDSRDKLFLIRANVQNLTRIANADTLVINSTPRKRARPGDVYRYQMQAVSSGKNISYSFKSCPDGMDISATGLITWSVDTAEAGKKHDVVIAVKDSNNLVRLQKFTIKVLGE